MKANEFSLRTQAGKKELEVASLNPIDEAMTFAVECDASESTISVTLNQAGRPVAFMSRTLAVEKEATVIIEVNMLKSTTIKFKAVDLS